MTDLKTGYITPAVFEVHPAKRNKIERMTLKLTQEDILGHLLSIFPVRLFCHLLHFVVFKVHSCTFSHWSLTVMLRVG